MEQVQLQLERQFQTGYGGDNPLHASVDINEIIYIDSGKFNGFLNFAMLRFQNTRQCFLLIGYGVNQFGDGFTAFILMIGGFVLGRFQRNNTSP